LLAVLEPLTAAAEDEGPGRPLLVATLMDTPPTPATPTPTPSRSSSPPIASSSPTSYSSNSTSLPLLLLLLLLGMLLLGPLLLLLLLGPLLLMGPLPVAGVGGVGTHWPSKLMTCREGCQGWGVV
jgi:hypothetical protein